VGAIMINKKNKIILTAFSVTIILFSIFYYLHDRGDLTFLDSPKGLFNKKNIGNVFFTNQKKTFHFSFIVRYKKDHAIYMSVENYPEKWMENKGRIIIMKNPPKMYFSTVIDGKTQKHEMKDSDWHINTEGSLDIKIGNIETSKKNQLVDVYIETYDKTSKFNSIYGSTSISYQYLWQ
jgi:hypothetical protein